MFAHRLVAAGIGGQTVSGLSENMELDEFYRWMAYDTIFPIGNEDINTARIMLILAAINTPKDKPRPKLTDFLFGKMPERQLSIDEMEAKFNAYFGIASDETPD